MKIRFQMTVSPAVARWGLAIPLLLAAATDLSSESLTLSTYYPAPSGVYTQLVTSDATYLARDAGGAVAIGNVTPSTLLDVNGNVLLSAGTPLLSLFSTAGPTVAAPAVNILTMSVGGAEKLRVDASGNVGLGTTVPTSKLHVSTSLVLRGCTTGRTETTFAYNQGYQSCGAMYATWIPGLMSNSQTMNHAEVGGAMGGKFYCCPCPPGGCPALPAYVYP